MIPLWRVCILLPNFYNFLVLYRWGFRVLFSTIQLVTGLVCITPFPSAIVVCEIWRTCYGRRFLYPFGQKALFVVRFSFAGGLLVCANSPWNKVNQLIFSFSLHGTHYFFAWCLQMEQHRHRVRQNIHLLYRSTWTMNKTLSPGKQFFRRTGKLSAYTVKGLYRNLAAAKGYLRSSGERRFSE